MSQPWITCPRPSWNVNGCSRSCELSNFSPVSASVPVTRQSEARSTEDGAVSDKGPGEQKLGSLDLCSAP
jgi:hypothetical protein